MTSQSTSANYKNTYINKIYVHTNIYKYLIGQNIPVVTPDSSKLKRLLVPVLPADKGH